MIEVLYLSWYFSAVKKKMMNREMRFYSTTFCNIKYSIFYKFSKNLKKRFTLFFVYLNNKFIQPNSNNKIAFSVSIFFILLKPKTLCEVFKTSAGVSYIN